MKKLTLMASALSVAGLAIIGMTGGVRAEGPTLSEADFEESKNLYFQRCAGCHGVL